MEEKVDREEMGRRRKGTRGRKDEKKGDCLGGDSGGQDLVGWLYGIEASNREGHSGLMDMLGGRKW